MTEVLISFQRPASMTESEMRAWITERQRASEPRLALGGPEDSDRQPRLLRVEVGGDSIRAAEEQLTDLLMDMRLLGLRPTVVPARGLGL